MPILIGLGAIYCKELNPGRQYGQLLTRQYFNERLFVKLDADTKYVPSEAEIV